MNAISVILKGTEAEAEIPTTCRGVDDKALRPGFKDRSKVAQ